MRQWELQFIKDENVYRAEVPADARPLLETYKCLGFAFRFSRTLQLYTEEQIHHLMEKMEKSELGRHAARRMFMFLELIEDPEVLNVPVFLAEYADVDQWDNLRCLLIEDERQLWLVSPGNREHFLEGLELFKEERSGEEE